MRKTLCALVATLGVTAAMALPAGAATMAPDFGRGGGVHAPAGHGWGEPGHDRGPGRYGHGCFDRGRYVRACRLHGR